MNFDDVSDLSSPLTSIPSSPLSSPPDSPALPPGWGVVTPPPSQHAGDDMPRPRKRRKIEAKPRTTQHLDLTSDTAQSEYDRQEAMDTLLKALRGRRKIVVIAGAGISTSAGIPDFRSSHGLFRSLKGEHKLKSSGKELFDASVYKDDSSTSSFHDMVRKLSTMSEAAKPSPFHRFLARLSVEGRLLRLYTQNIDGLETVLPPLKTQVPLNHKAPWPQTIQLHGGLEKMMCQKCRHISDFQAHLFEGPTPPACPECVAADTMRTAHAGKRSHGVGKLRPRIVLYNEHNPDDEAIGAVTAADFRTRPDAVIVVGTSMKIPTVKRITREMCQIVRDRKEGTTIWINRDPVPTGKDFENCWDLIVKGDCDDVAGLAALKDWDDPTPEVAETYTEDDLRKVTASQGEVQVVVPSTPQKTKNVAQRLLPPAPIHTMTPPRSQNGDKPKAKAKAKAQLGNSSPSKAGRGTPQVVIPSPTKLANLSPRSLKLLVGERSREAEKKRQAAVTNAASTYGRKLADVLGKENSGKPAFKSKTSLNRKMGGEKRKRNQLPASQGTIMGKVTKSAASAGSKKPEPLSPRRHSNETVPPKPEYSSIEPTPIPETPPDTTGAGDWRSMETVSPTGRVPSDMVKLLN